MRRRSTTIFAPLSPQDSASPDLDPSPAAHIPPTPESPPLHSRKTSPKRMSQLGTPSRSSRRRSRTVSQGNREGGNLPTPTNSSDSDEDNMSRMMISDRSVQDSGLAQADEGEMVRNRRGNSRIRTREDGEALTGPEENVGGDDNQYEEQDPMLQQIARERRLVWEESRSRNFGRKKWLILVGPSESPIRNANSSRYSTISSFGQNEGVLLPLQPTLPAQAQLIAREFSLSSISGIQLYLCLPDSPSSRARLTESSWRVLWTDHLEGRSYAETLRGANGLPIAGRIEFDVDHNRSSRHPRRIDKPYSSFTSFTPSRTASPTPRFGTSLPYSRSTIPSWSDTHRSEVRRSSYRDENENDSEPEQSDQTRASFSRNQLAFQTRPLSTLSQASGRFQNPSSPSSSRITCRASTPTSPSASRIDVKQLFDQDLGERSSSPTKPRGEMGVAASTPLVRPRSTSRIFSFPRPYSRDTAGDESSEDRSREESTLNWTIELDRLREVSETSLFAGGSEGDNSFSEDANTSSAALLTARSRPESANQPTFHSHPVPIEPLSLATLPRRPSNTYHPSISTIRYPYISIYPSVYPHFDLYPPKLASNLPSLQTSESPELSDAIALSGTLSLALAEIEADKNDRLPSIELEEEDCHRGQASTSEGEFIDDSVEWYLTATPSERSPASSSYDDDEDGERTSDSDGEGLFAVYDGTMLSIIQEESDTRSFTAQIEANDSRDGRVIEAIVEETTDELASGGSEGVSFNDKDKSPDVPVITYSKPNISYPSQTDHSQSSRPPSLELDRATSSPSPLPSPTITPSTFPSDIPEAPEDADEQDEFDCSFEYEAEVGTDELPYITSPGLKHALGLDDSPEIQPLSFPSDESESDSDESFYKTRDFALDRQGVDHFVSGGEGDDSCQTFDHLTPLPETSTAEDDLKPLLFAFPSSQSRDMLDAMAQFVCEAQTQSIDRRGKFRIAFGTGQLPSLLRLALENDERVEWEKWEIFCVESETNGSTRTTWEEFFAHFPLSPSQIHLPQATDDDVKPPSEEYERQLLSAFPGVGLFAGDPIPRFDLVLLNVEEQARLMQLSTSSHNANRWITTNSSNVSFTPSLLSASRRIAVLALGHTQQLLLTNMLSRSDGEHAKNVVYFADESAVEGLDYPRTSFWGD